RATTAQWEFRCFELIRFLRPGPFELKNRLTNLDENSENELGEMNLQLCAWGILSTLDLDRTSAAASTMSATTTGAGPNPEATTTSDKIRVLFVDDEDMVLRMLRIALSSMQGEWDTSFATSGEEALKLLANSPFDMIVSDMRMPGMTGAQ